jgi:hypothetical protein
MFLNAAMAQLKPRGATIKHSADYEYKSPPNLDKAAKLTFNLLAIFAGWM